MSKTREELITLYEPVWGRERAEKMADERVRARELTARPLPQPKQQQTVTPPSPETPSKLPSETPKQAEARAKRGKQVRDILKRLLNGEHVVRENSGKLYNIRNVGECVRKLREMGYHIYNHEPEGVFEYYYMRAEDIADYRRNNCKPLVEARG
jgi:hypothetical protein